MKVHSLKCLMALAFFFSISLFHANAQYCIPSFTVGNLTGTYINGISINGYSNTTGPDATAPNFYVSTNVPLTLVRGSSHILTYETGFSDSNAIAAWIDYNVDGDFTDAGENIVQTFEPIGNTTGSSTVFVPNTAISGLTMLRIRISKNAGPTNLNGCVSYSYGETEDYIVNLVDACVSTPSAGTLNPVYILNINDTVTLSAAGAWTGVQGLTYEWVVSDEPGFTPIDSIITTASPSLNITGLSSAMYYQLKVTCTNTGESEYSSTAVVYPVSTSCTPVPSITSVTNSTNQITVNLSGGPVWLVSLDPGNSNPAMTYLTSSPLSSVNTDSIYNQAGIYTACAIAYSVCGATVSEPSNSGCTNVDLTCFTPPVLTGNVNDALCFQNADGAIDLGVATNALPLSFSWNNGATAEDIANLMAGTYCVTVVDSIGCSSSACYAVGQSAALFVNAFADNDTASSSWWINSLASGGTGPYNYNWSTGDTSPDIANLPPGNYCLTVTDANGCSLDSCFEIGTLACDTMFSVAYTAGADTSFILTMDSLVQTWSGTYSWDFGDGSGSTTNPFPVHTYAVNGIYNVCLEASTPSGALCVYCHAIGIDSLGNVVMRTDADGFIVKVVAPGHTAVTATQEPAFFTFHPNPVSNEGTLNFYASKPDNYSFYVYNALGQKVKSLAFKAKVGLNKLSVPTENLSKGMYLLSMFSGSEQTNLRFVK